MSDPVMIAALAMRKLQALRLLATPGVRTSTDVVLAIINDLERALIQAPAMRLKLRASTVDWGRRLRPARSGRSPVARRAPPPRRARGRPRRRSLPRAARPGARGGLRGVRGRRRRDPPARLILHLRPTDAVAGPGRVATLPPTSGVRRLHESRPQPPCPTPSSSSNPPPRRRPSPATSARATWSSRRSATCATCRAGRRTCRRPTRANRGRASASTSTTTSSRSTWCPPIDVTRSRS